MTADRPRRRGAAHYAAVALAFVLAAIHAYLGTVVTPFGSGASARFLLVGAVFLVGVVVYLTAYFRPVLYLLGSLYAVFLGVAWVLGGTTYLPLGVLTGVVGTAFVLLTAALFVREDAFTA